MTAQADFHAAIAKLELQSQATKDLLTSKLDAYLTAIKLGIEGVTADASELNLTTGLKAGTLTPKLFECEASILEVNAGDCIVAPSKSGHCLIPVDAWMVAVGADPAGSTLIRLVEETSDAVVMSHVVADFANNAWVGKAGGTVVTTKLGTPLASGKSILVQKTGDALTGATAIRCLVLGFYIEAPAA